MKPMAPKTANLARLRQRILHYVKAEGGTASLEFVICIPVILAIFMASIESGVLMTRYIVMEQSVDIVMRKLRLGQYPTVNADLIKDEICSRTMIMADCRTNIAIEMTPIDTTNWSLPTTRVGCADRSQTMQPSLAFNPGAPQEIMLVRVCIAQNALFPTTGIGLRLPKDAQGGYGLVAIAAYVNEP
jgi:Flp pilus assembly protein TadG